MPPLIEYEDLIVQLTQFREDVIRALAAIDVEITALQNAVTGQSPVEKRKLHNLRAEAQKRMSKFQEFHSQEIVRLDERR